ncbi:Card1-like endonuclease domain-containing protein [Acidithiobacillus caldus]
MRVHLCIVSDQVLPNLIPVLQEHPDEVLLLSSQAMGERTTQLAQQIRRQGIGVQILEGMPDHGLESIYAFALEVEERLARDYREAEITLNATGGNKLMALGLVEFFHDRRVLYTDTAHRRLEVLPGPGWAPAEIPMEDVLTVPVYLSAQGFQVRRVRSRQEEWRSAAQYRKGFCKRLAELAPRADYLIYLINKAAFHALNEQGQLVAPEQTIERTPRGAVADILSELNQRDLLAWKVGTREIVFRDADTARFLSGGWLEEYVYHVLKDNHVFDVALGVEGQWLNGRGSKNEFDVLATHHNALLFVECKTLAHRAAHDSDIAYKIEALGRDARGLFGASWLVTARQPTAHLLDHARRARFEVIGPEALPKLRDPVRQWLEGE